MERRSRSKSRVPTFADDDDDDDDGNVLLQNEANHLQQTLNTLVTRKLRTTRTVTAVQQHYSSSSASQVRNGVKRNKTSKHQQSSLNDALVDGYLAENNVSFDTELEPENRIALKMYREAKQYWNTYPKTDYTYSPHSKDRIELAPGIVNMPNMSRKSIHNTSSTFLDYSNKETNTDITSSRTISPRNLFDVRRTRVDLTTTTMASFMRRLRIYFGAVAAACMVPLVMAHAINEMACSYVYRAASFLMRLDTWFLRSAPRNRFAQSSARKMLHVLLLFLVPLLLLAGLWYLSSAYHTVLEVVPTLVPFLLPARTDSEAIPAAIPSHPLEHKPLPGIMGLTGEQLQHISHSLRDKLNLNVHPDVIAQALMAEPSLYAGHKEHQQLDDEVVARIARVLSAAATSHDPAVRDQLTEQEKLIKDLQAQIAGLRLDLNKATSSNAAQYMHVARSLKQCCRFNALQIEKYARAAESEAHKLAMYVTLHELEAMLDGFAQKSNARMDELITANAQTIMDEVFERLRLISAVDETTHFPPNETLIQAIVKQALAKYDADKTGVVDYALESAGGQILSTRCTEHYSAHTSVVSIFGIPLWYPKASPRTVITPGVAPGECWAFQGFPGFIVVRLSYNVSIEAFSYEHVSKRLIPSGRIDSAPKDFQVYGLDDPADRERTLIGEFRYDADGDALQTFLVTDAQRKCFQIIELKVHSNHGNPNYTCLYRFRVHGKIATYN